jgi:hypothetical protein
MLHISDISHPNFCFLLFGKIMVNFSLVAVSAPKSSDHTDYSNLQFYGKRGITQNFLKFQLFPKRG